MKSDWKFSIVLNGLSIVVAICICAVLVIGSAWMESSAYNRLTGANTTILDAIVLDLRVADTSVKNEKSED